MNEEMVFGALYIVTILGVVSAFFLAADIADKLLYRFSARYAAWVDSIPEDEEEDDSIND